MLPWLTEPSFPVVTLRYNPIDKRLHASQTPCSPLSNATWFVPLEVQVDDKLYTIYLNETERCAIFARFASLSDTEIAFTVRLISA